MYHLFIQPPDRKKPKRDDKGSSSSSTAQHQDENDQLKTPPTANDKDYTLLKTPPVSQSGTPLSASQNDSQPTVAQPDALPPVEDHNNIDGTLPCPTKSPSHGEQDTHTQSDDDDDTDSSDDNGGGSGSTGGVSQG